MAEDINNNIEAQNRLLKEQNALFGAQVGLSRELTRHLEDRFRKTSSSSKDATNSILENMGAMEDYGTTTGGTFDMLRGKIRGVGDAFSGFINSPEIATAVRLYNQFYSDVAEAGNKVLNIQKKIFHANEAIRGSFGDLSRGVGQDVLQISDAFQSVGDVAGTGLVSIFGFLEDGTVAQKKFFNEVMGGFGNLINTITISNKELFGELTVSLVKGAGLSDKALGGLGALTKKTGKSIEQTMGFVNERIATLSSQTGVSAKFIGKNLTAMLEDLGTFGHRTEAELVNLAATTAMLGVEMSDLQGIANKFDQFDTAAESVARLNQAFGLQLDAMKLMNAPVEERIAMLQDSFAATGRSFEDLSRQERQYLAQQAGIDAGQLDKFFGAYAEGADDAMSSAEAAAEAQMTQEEAMVSMSKNIERLRHVIEGLGGAFDAAGKGFTEGFLRSASGNKLGDYYRQLERINLGAMKIGSSFGNVEPIKKFFGSLSKGLEGFNEILNKFNASDKSKKDFTDAFKGMVDLGVQQMKNFGTAVKDIATTAFEYLGEIPFFAGFVEKAEGAFTKFEEIFGGVGDLFGAIFGANGQSPESRIDAIGTAMEGFGTKVDEILAGFSGGFSETTTSISNFIGGWAQNLGDLVAVELGGLYEKLKLRLAPKMGALMAGAFFGAEGALMAGQAAIGLGLDESQIAEKIKQINEETAKSREEALSNIEMPKVGDITASLGVDIGGLFDTSSELVKEAADQYGESARDMSITAETSANTAQKEWETAKLQESNVNAFGENVETLGESLQPPEGEEELGESPVAVVAPDAFADLNDQLSALEAAGATVINTDLYIDGGKLREYLIGKGVGVFKATA